MTSHAVHSVFLLLGSNQNNPIEQLRLARHYIITAGHEIKLFSPIYKTAPWGVINQPDFYNQAIHVLTNQEPHLFLQETQMIEQKMGRKREEKWGPRNIDIDILFFDDLVISDPELSIPHPQLPYRRFALAPLADIAPDHIHPSLHTSVTFLLATCHDDSDVVKIA